ncbi:MAG: EAL domain-containing protein [Actinomycetia bacterium]|nr:EAL domain-containing protein [Actinomycetes bacterium]MCH9760611.1 EAL domain-containing protein [Actinomycetes bacterium]
MPTPSLDHPDARLEAALARSGPAIVVVVLGAAVANWFGWVGGIEILTRFSASWPAMTPWTAALLATLGVAILVQSGNPSPTRVWAGRGLAVAAGVLGAVFLAEYVTGPLIGLDQRWFSDAVLAWQSSWPGRPSPRTGLSVLLLAVGVGLTRVDRRWVPGVWAASLVAAMAPPLVVLAAYSLQALSLVGVTPSTGMGISTAVALPLLISATFITRRDRDPLAWLLARPDKWTLVRMAAVLAGPPILIGLLRIGFLQLGVSDDAAWVLSIAVSTVLVGVATFYLSQREQKLLIEKEGLSRRGAEAESRYRLLADNAVDVIVHIRGTRIEWVSPSAEAAFGWPRELWTGAEFDSGVHPGDLTAVEAALQAVTRGNSDVVRCRVTAAGGGYRWTEAHGKPYIDAEGNTDGVIFALRVVDQQVRVQQQLNDQKERFESVVGRTPSAISVRDPQHRYTMVNEAFCELFGQKSVEDVIGRTQDSILPPDVLDRSRRAADRLMNGESFVEEESITKGHKDISVITQRFPLRNAAGTVTELVTIRTDITHRKKIEQETAEQARWQERIGTAIGDGRLMVYSQPIVDITTGEPVEEELLVRLRAVGSDEVMPPSAFLPQCERHGLMPLIDRYMVGRAIELAHTGRHVSVNITGQTIADATTMGSILEALTIAGPEITDKIAFEITETTALASPAIARAFSESMRDRGCRVALDDFGTGYGTFTELRHLALHTLKIDLSFVQKMLEDREDERVVATIVLVARTYGLTTTAEGVESQEVLERLAELGANRAQGFLFGKPKPVVA